MDRVCAGAAYLVEDFRLGKLISKEAPNCPEMEFLNGIFDRGFWTYCKLESFPTQVFVWASTSCFGDFFVCISKQSRV
jgi:hypothetical protein